MASFTIIMFGIALLTNGTCDEGDSISHYLLARYAFAHPENFFNHWAKPFYVLMMSPFAQFGFIGVKLFNTLLSCVSVSFTYLIARELKYKWALFVFAVALFFRYFLDVTFSGLTEPLCNVMITIALYLALKKKYLWAALIMSFIPFVRSEGLFLCFAFGLFLLAMNQWKYLPALLIGHIVYSIAGYPLHKDLLWVFSRIPYARYTSHYGHGSWLYYFEQMPVIAGVVNSILLSFGIILTFFSFLFTSDTIKQKCFFSWNILFIGIFLLFFIMHASFWALGIFGSFGMIRVFIAIASIMMLIILSAIEQIDIILSKWISWHRPFVIVTVLTLSSLFALGPSPYAYSHSDFELHTDQIIDIEAADFIKLHYPQYNNYHLFFDASYFGEILNVDVFNNTKVQSIDQVSYGANYPNKSIVIWDDWYSDFEHGLHLEALRNNKSLTEIKTFEKPKPRGEPRRVVLFVKDN